MHKHGPKEGRECTSQGSGNAHANKRRIVGISLQPDSVLHEKGSTRQKASSIVWNACSWRKEGW